MYLTNFIIISFMAVTIYTTSYRICDNFQARQFLELAKYLPIIPSKVPTYCMIFLVLLGASSIVKDNLQATNKWLLIVLFFLDLILCTLITYYINFSYKGIFLFIVASVFLHIPWLSIRILFFSITLICFIVLDYDFLNVKMNIVSLQHYINFYSSQTQIYFYSLKNTMDSFNLILFISFFLFLIQAKISENKEYIDLNNKLKEKVEELKVANEKLEIYTKKSAEMAKMKERNRLAREIHDILGHSLTSITTGIEACLDLIDSNPPKAKKHIIKIREISQKGLVDVRRSVKELKVDSIEKYALIPAIKQLVEELNTFSGTQIDLHIEGQELKMKNDEGQAVYRVIQESITNALRHGKATYVRVDLIFKHDELIIKVRDNGKGCQAISKGFGLMHIEERIRMLGGQVEFQSVQNRGFTTLVSIPTRWRISL